MPASPGGSLATRVHLDANALIDYIRERALHDTGRPPTGRRADALRKRLDQARHVLVAETAGVEAQRNLPKDLVRKLGRSEAREVMGHALELLHQYRGDVERSDHVEYVSAAREMYAAIRSDPDGQKHSEWKRKKGAFVDDPVLGSDANDLQILSTAAYYARRHPVELWTHDMDFTMFADEIWDAFALKVVDTYRLGA